jgi:hypothetical protein
MSRATSHGYDEEIVVVRHERPRNSPRVSTHGDELVLIRPAHSPRPPSRSPRPPPESRPEPSSRDRVRPSRGSREPYKRLIIAADGESYQFVPTAVTAHFNFALFVGSIRLCIQYQGIKLRHGRVSADLARCSLEAANSLTRLLLLLCLYPFWRLIVCLPCTIIQSLST